MVDEQFRVDSEKPVENIFVHDGHPRNVSHCEHSATPEPFHRPPSDSPEVCQRSVFPVFPAVGHLVQLRNPDTVLVGGTVLRLDVHRNFGKVKVGANSRSSGNACGGQYVTDHPQGQVVGRASVGLEVIRHVNEDLVNRIDLNVLLCHIFQIDGIYLRADFHIFLHPRRSRNEVKSE